MGPPNTYIRALRYRWLTRFYDRIVRALVKEQTCKRRLVTQSGLVAGQRVLDLGCGTATLTIMLKERCPGAHVIGLDADPDILSLARTKAQAASVDIEFHQGMAHAPPFAPASFDRILSSLLFHHLTSTEKSKALGSARELLRPGGELHVLDWGKAQNLLMRFAFLSVQFLDGFATTTDNVRGRLIPLMREARFNEVAECHRETTLLGTLSFYRAVRPKNPGASSSSVGTA